MNPLRILIVEPRPAEAHVMTRLAAEACAGAEVRRVPDADEAVAVLEASPADVVLCAQGMDILAWHAGAALVAVVDDAGAGLEALRQGAHAVFLSAQPRRAPLSHAITEARRAHRLQVAQDRAMFMVHRSPDGFWVCGADGLLREVNEAYCRLLGHHRRDLIGLPIHVLEARPDPHGTRMRLRDIMTEGGDRFETVYRRRDGSTVDVEISAHYRPETGEIIGFLRDVSERKALVSALAESERRFRDISIAAGEYLWEVDARGRCTYVSERIEQVQGYTPAEVLGRTPFAFMEPEEARRVRTWLARSADDGQPFRDMEFRSRHKAGHQVWLRVSGMPILDASGALAGYRGTALDITQRKVMEENLRRLATTDPLTGAANRRHFMAVLDDELARAQRYGNPLSVAMVDIDHFKRLNDTYGHAAGDAALVQFVTEIQARLRATDLLGRLGGEEFALILPETTAEGARAVVDALRAAREAAVLDFEGEVITFTMSAGVADTTHADTGATLLAAADAALYDSKHGGRNRVTVAKAPTSALVAE